MYFSLASWIVYVKNIMLGLFTSLGILGLLGLHFLSLLGYLPITHSFSINRGLCIHYQYQTQYNVVLYASALFLLPLHNIFNNIFNMVSKLFNMASEPLFMASNLTFLGILSGDLTFLVIHAPPSGHPLKNSSTPSL